MKERRSNVAVATLLTLLTLAVLAMSSITVSAIMVSASTEKVIKGDLNADSNVNCFDMVLMKRAILGSYDPDLERADLNSDGTVSIADAVMLSRFVLGTISNFETTTTAVKTNSTTTTTTTTSTSTTTTTWTPPKRESLIHDGETMDEETYELLTNTAKMFGVKHYDFEWSFRPIEYGYFDPGPLFCMEEGFAYGYGVQVLPSDQIDVLAPKKSKLERGEFKSGYEFLLYRPILSDDNESRVLESFEQTEDAFKTEDGLIISGMLEIIEAPNYKPGDEPYEFELSGTNAYNPVDFIGWYLVPLDEDGNKIEAIPEKYDTAVDPAKSIRYWFKNDQLRSAGFSIPLGTFYNYVDTGILYDIPNYKIVYNEDSENPIMYSFEVGNTGITDIKVGAVQIIPYWDLSKVVDLHKYCLEYMQGGEGFAAELENNIVEGKDKPFYYVTLAGNSYLKTGTNTNVVYVPNLDIDTHMGYMMLPLNEEGQEDLRPYPVLKN